MSRLLFRLLDIMRFRAGPQDLPAAWSIAFLMAMAYVAEGYFADYLLDDTDVVPRALVSVALQFLVVALLLQLRQQFSRFSQTITALAGTGLIFGAVSILIVIQVEPGKAAPGLALLWYGTFLWSLAVDAHIYRHALSITMSLGVLVAVVMFALNFFIIEMMFPA